MKTFCLICCRGGSKGIPRKNIRAFAGKPLLHWTLEHAVKSYVFDQIFVSTDAKEIASCAEEVGISVPFLRPKELALDDSDQFLTHQHVFEALSITDFTHRVCILLNNPFINADLIRESYKIASSQGFKRATIDCVKVSGDYIYARQMRQDRELLINLFPEEYLTHGSNRQTLPETFSPVNNLIWGMPSYLNDRSSFKTKIVNEGLNPFYLTKTQNFDLDDDDDWFIAEAVMNSILERNCLEY